MGWSDLFKAAASAFIQAAPQMVSAFADAFAQRHAALLKPEAIPWQASQAAVDDELERRKAAGQ